MFEEVETVGGNLGQIRAPEIIGNAAHIVADERFKNSIDKHSIGTAEFVSKAIKYYTNENIEISKFEFKKPTLNDIFIEKVGE